MKPGAFLLPLLLLAAGCAGHRVTVANVVHTLTPETVSVGLTAPNLLNGPVATTRSGQSRRDATGQIGATISVTYRLKPIRIERAEVQPVRVVAGTPSPSPTAPAR